MEVIKIIKDESLLFGKTSVDFSSSINPNDVTSFSPTKALETKEVNLGGWFVDIEATLSEKSKIEQDYILLVETKSSGVQPFRIHNKEVKKRRVLARAHHVMFDSELYLVENYSASNLATGTVLNGLNDNLDRTSPFTYVVSHAGSITMDFSGMTLLECWEFLVDNKAALVDADWYRIYFRNEMGEDRGVTISHGKDLEDIVGTEDWSTVVTKIFPYTSGGVTLPEKYLMSETQYNRPYTRRVEIEVDVEGIKEQHPDYTDEQLIPLIQAQLRINAERYLEDAQYPQVTYRVSSNVAEDLNLWDKILVKHPAITYNLPLEGPVDQEAIDRLGIPTKVLAYQYDVIAKRTIKLDYGDFYANFSKLFNNKLDKITEEWKRVENNLEERLNAQTELINNWNKKGHMVLLENEILFLDKLPMDDAENVLKIGLGGIAFSKTGVDGDFTSAWDLEGNFNTEFIGAGSITVNQLSSDVGSSLDLSSNESVNILVTDKVIEEVDKIELPPGPPGPEGPQGESVFYAYADEIDREIFGDNILTEGERHFNTPPWEWNTMDVGTVTPAPKEVFDEGYTRNIVDVGVSGTANGVNITFNDDGSFTLDGTSTASGSVYIISNRVDIAGLATVALFTNMESAQNNFILRVTRPDGTLIDTAVQAEKTTSLVDLDYIDSVKLRFQEGNTFNGETFKLKIEKGENPNPVWTPAWEDLPLENKPVSFIETNDVGGLDKLVLQLEEEAEPGKEYEYSIKVKNIGENSFEFRNLNDSLVESVDVGQTKHIAEVVEGQGEHFGIKFVTDAPDQSLKFYALDLSIRSYERKEFSGFTTDNVVKKWRGYRVGLEPSNDPYDYQWELSPNEIQKTLRDHESRIEVNSEGIQLEASTREENFSELSNSLLETSGALSVLSDQVNVELEERLTSAEGRIETANQIINSVDESVQTFTTRIETVEGELEEHQTVYRRDASGITLGGTDWETTMHADGENLTFISEGGDVKAQFGANGMYTNRWLTDFHALEKFEEGNIRLTIWRDRRVDD